MALILILLIIFIVILAVSYDLSNNFSWDKLWYKLGIKARETGTEALKNKVTRRVIVILISGAILSFLLPIIGLGQNPWDLFGGAIMAAVSIGAFTALNHWVRRNL